MSSSPHGLNKFDDEPEGTHLPRISLGPGPVALDGSQVKRGRGRPKGSKNKKPSTSAAPGSPPGAETSEGTIKKKRGRPPKDKKTDEVTTDVEQQPPKRKRGRPPKHSKPDTGGESGANGEAAESSSKRKRGRPPKQV